ncbi:MAG: CPBP family intramembrane metalloprotease [Clostridiales bacterium]|nr:CPBP family intramembrane metalloprotease [Clostridiales bacterium]
MDQNRKYTTVHSVRILVIAMAVSMAAGLIIQVIKDPNIKTLVSILIPQVCYLAVGLILIKKEQFPIKDIVPSDIGVYPLGVLLTIPIAAAVVLQNLVFATSFGWLADKLKIGLDVTLDIANPIYAVFGVLIIAILPAVSEEFMFRGVIMSSLRERGFWYSVFVSAAVFALSHLNVKQLIHPFLLGSLLAYITLKTGNITYAVCIHFINNVIALFMNQIPFFANLMIYSPKNLGILFGLMALGAVVLYPTVWLLLKATQSSQRFRKYSEPSPYEKASEKPIRGIDKPILFLCVVFVALMFLTAFATAFSNIKTN